MSQDISTPTYLGYEAFLESYRRQGWTDGLPVVPPTPNLVERFLSHLGADADEVITQLAGVEVSAASVAEHAILAGCAPEYLPVVVAAARSHFSRLNPGFEASPGWAESALSVIVNGPMRRELGVASQQACMGPGWAANAAIGRTLNFVARDTYSRAGIVTSPAFASPDAYTFCFGEDEEESPWEPLHVERGFPLESSTATVHAVIASLPSQDATSRDPEGVLETLAKRLDARAAVGGRWPGHKLNMVFVVCKEVQRVFEDARWAKSQLRTCLWDKVKRRRGPAAETLGDPEDSLIVAAGGLGMQWIWVLVSSDLKPVTTMVEPPGGVL